MRSSPRITLPVLLRLAALALAAGLAGCQGGVPGRSGVDLGSAWRPTGVVQADLDAQLADPHDLVHGRSAAAIPAAIVTPGVTAWMSGKGGASAGGGGSSGGGASGGSAGGSVGNMGGGAGMQ